MTSGAWQGRLTALPLYEDEGHCLLHLGVSGGWRSGTNNLANAPFALNTVQLRARPEMRDDVPAGDALNGNSNRLIDTGILATEDDFLLGLELLSIRGPLSFQAEYGWNFANHVIGVAPSPTGLHPALAPPVDYVFEGGYVQLAYTLTGRNSRLRPARRNFGARVLRQARTVSSLVHQPRRRRPPHFELGSLGSRRSLLVRRPKQRQRP